MEVVQTIKYYILPKKVDGFIWGQINQAGHDEVQAHRDEGNCGNTGVPSDPTAESTPKSLRPSKSLPSKLRPNTQASVGGSTNPRPKLPSWRFMKSGLNKLTGRKVPTSVSALEINQQEVSPVDNTKGEEHFRWTSPCVDPDKVYGFKEELQALESFIRRENDQGFRAVAVVGDGGIGKTTLCQLLFNEKGIKEEFVPRIWVSNSRLPAEDKDLKSAIVRRMLTQIGEDITDDMELDKLMALLHRNLWGKKYLIILDDARDADSWYYNLGAVPNMDNGWKTRLAYGLPKGSGGRVVVTGRNEEVARKMVGEHNLQKVLPLSNMDYCWSIFEESVGPGLDEAVKNNGTSVEAMKKEVYDKSSGRPLAIKIMGQIMKEQLREASKDRIDSRATA